MTITINPAAHTFQKVSRDLFGANALFQIDDMGNGQFAENFDFFNASGIRWPGGSITEAWFDPRHPDTPLAVPRRLSQQLSHDEVLTFTEVMDFGRQTGRPLTIVLPTIHILSGDGSLDKAALNDIRNFVKVALAPGGAYADARIAAFEMGNEYWSAMTSKDYGKLLNAIIKVVDLGIKESGASYEPKILAQVGDAWGPDFEKGGEYYSKGLKWGEIIGQANEDIIGQLDSKARGLIDGLIDHFYPDMNTEVSIWSSQKRQSVWADSDLNLDLHVTEWNVKSSKPLPEGMPVFAQGTVFAETFEAMVRMKVGSAFVWPVNHSTRTDLGGRDGSGAGHLSITGGVYKLLSENVCNLSLVDLTIENHDILETSLYRSASKSVLFLSRDDGKPLIDSIDLRAIAAPDPKSGATLKVTEKRVIRDEGEDKYVGRGAGAEIVTIRTGTAADLAAWSVQMNQHEVTMIKVEWVLPTRGAGIIGGPGDDRLNGSAASELISGLAGNDAIMAGSGNDTLNGGGGRDTLSGGSGNDLLAGGSDDDTLRGDNGRDHLLGNAGSDNLEGGADADTLDGGLGNDMLDGGTGDDIIAGDSGADRIVAGSGNDSVDAGTGNDLVLGGAGNDKLRGGAGNDSLCGEDGVDSIYGDDGSDTIRGGSGNDLVGGGSGDDRIYGDEGNDNLVGGTGEDQVEGGAGNDTLDGASGNDILSGGAGDDNLIGGLGNDLIYGSAKGDSDAGNDTLSGGFGNDTLYGGAGGDVFHFGRGMSNGGTGIEQVYGGSGADVFVFKGTSGWTGIHDFEDGVDKISFAGRAIGSIDDLKISQISEHGHHVIRIDYADEMGGGTIRLEPSSGDLLLKQITASDFIF